MSKHFWSDEDDFRDTPADSPDPHYDVAPAQPPARAQQRAPEPQVYQPAYQAVTEEDEDALDAAVLSDAQLRLEQGKLYQLIMSHSLFDGEEVDPRAAKNVEREIRRFARERMEIMLGMRQEQSKQPTSISPFNEIEVMVLKQLASTATKGVSASAEAEVAPRKVGLNTIKKPAETATAKPLQPKAKNAPPPVSRPAPQAPVEEPSLNKPVHELSRDELVARNQRIGERQAQQKSAPPKNILPMPTFEQQQAMHTIRAANAPNDLSANILNLINSSGRK